MSQCQICSAESDLFLCKKHIQHLSKALTQIPWLLDQLEITITKQDRINTGSGRKSKSEKQTRSVLNLGASNLKSEVDILLQRWVGKLVGQHGLKFLPSTRVPADFIGPLQLGWERLPIGWKITPGKYAIWLAHHVNTLAGREDVRDFYHEILGLVIDPDHPKIPPGRLVAEINKKTKTFAGACPTRVGYGQEGEPVECGRILYAHNDAAEAYCTHCQEAGRPYTVDAHHNRMRSMQSRDLLTEKGLLEAMDVLEEHVPRVTLYKWLEEKRLHIRGYLHDGQIVPKKIRNSDPRVMSLSQARALFAQSRMAEVAS